MASKNKPAEPSVKLVHRSTPRGQHRLEIHDPNKQPEIGEWVSSREVAQLGAYRATTDNFNGVLPKVFKVAETKANEVTD